MSRLRLPLMLLLALCALAVSAAPALAVASPPAVVAFDDDDGDDEWAFDEESGEWGDDVLCADEDGEPLSDDECLEDEGTCEDEWDEWSDEEDASVASVASDDDWGDDASFDEWADDEDWGDEECDEEAIEEIAPARLTGLRATPARRNAVKVSFRLDRKGAVTLSLRRVGARASGRRGRGAARGSVNVAGRRGANATTLRRWNGRPLRPGTYRLTATPADGRAATDTFTLRVAARRG